MADTLFIKPASGRVVIDPETGKALATEGEHKPNTTFWRKRLAAKAVAKTSPAKKEGGA